MIEVLRFFLPGMVKVLENMNKSIDRTRDFRIIFERCWTFSPLFFLLFLFHLIRPICLPLLSIILPFPSTPHSHPMHVNLQLLPDDSLFHFFSFHSFFLSFFTFFSLFFYLACLPLAISMHSTYFYMANFSSELFVLCCRYVCLSANIIHCVISKIGIL